MKYTNNYHLPQWSEDDLILMTDFNKMSEDIENGIDMARGEAAEAQAIANSAKITANAAMERPYAVGSYVGTGGDIDIALGFRPSFVIICGHLSGGALGTDMMMTFVFSATAGNVVATRIAFTDTGFRARAQISGHPYPDFSVSGRRYDYIAFK